MGVAASLALTLAALLCFGLAMARHHADVFGRVASPGAASALRAAGLVLAVAAPAPWIWQEGPTMALVTWLFCATPLAGLAAVAVFTWTRRPR